MGLVLGWDELPAETFVGLARRAEEQGYETLWVGETWARDAFSALTQIARLRAPIRPNLSST